jgi:hypothetical protein
MDQHGEFGSRTRRKTNGLPGHSLDGAVSDAGLGY